MGVKLSKKFEFRYFRSGVICLHARKENTVSIVREKIQRVPRHWFHRFVINCVQRRESPLLFRMNTNIDIRKRIIVTRKLLFSVSKVRYDIWS